MLSFRGQWDNQVEVFGGLKYRSGSPSVGDTGGEVGFIRK